MPSTSDPLWVPEPDRVAASRMTEFRSQVADLAGTTGPEGVHRWSVEQPAQFWSVVGTKAIRFGSLAEDATIQTSESPPGATFYPGAEVCLAEELLGGGTHVGASQTALVYRREDGWREEYTWAQLKAAAVACARGLAARGVGAGDRVAAWLPNCPEAVVTMLASGLIGAVYTSASPDFGPRALADRFAQVGPKVLVVADGYVYGGRRHDRFGALVEVLDLLPSVTDVWVVGELTRGEGSVQQRLQALAPQIAPVRIAAFNAETDTSAEPDEEPFNPFRVGYAHPGFILYSSGTTGKPKCLVHSGLGLLVKHWTEHALHCDIRPGDVVFFYTTTGWMMWNWLVGALAVGATIVLYDGSPLAPDAGSLWQIAAEEGVTFFGAGAKYYDACRSAAVQIAQQYPNPALRTVASTGSPLAPADFEYLYDQWGDAIHLASISGGTDICGCFVLGDPTAAVYSGEIQTPALGVDVDVVDADGNTLRERPGQRGDLICRNVLPSMPLRFWGDADFSAYRRAYFEGYPDVWTHGDFAEWTDHGGIVISGRSDATLNVGGVRIGTAEIYRQLVDFPLMDAMAVAQDADDKSRIVLFVQLKPGYELTDQLIAGIRARLRSHASPRHVPGLVVSVPDLPRTRSGKLAELVVADIVNGREVRTASGLANPEVLEWFKSAGTTHGWTRE